MFGSAPLFLVFYLCSGGPGGALCGVGEALQQVAQVRDTLDVNVTRTFIDPLQDLHDTELKDIRVRGAASQTTNSCVLGTPTC